MTAPLHTVHRVEALAPCLARMTADARLLLLEDAVYAALADHPQAATLAGRAVDVLIEHLAARGLDAMPLATGVGKIDMKGFVALTVEHTPPSVGSDPMTEHPFAPFIHILGKGPRLERPLTQAEAREAATIILDDKVAPEQLGAFLCLLQVHRDAGRDGRYGAGNSAGRRGNQGAAGRYRLAVLCRQGPAYAAVHFVGAVAGRLRPDGCHARAQDHAASRCTPRMRCAAWASAPPAISIRRRGIWPSAASLMSRWASFTHAWLLPLMSLKSLLGLRSPGSYAWSAI